MARKPTSKNTGIVKKIEKDSEEIIRDVEEILSTKKARKIEKYVIVCLYVLVFLVAGYFLVQAFLPKLLVSGTHQLSASDSDILSNLKTLYIDKNSILAGKIEIDNKTLRLITSAEPFNIVFNPKHIVPENTSAELQLYFYDVKTDVYLDNKLIIPNLMNYKKIQEFDKVEVWAKEDFVKENYDMTENVEDFIYKNYPQENIYSFAKLEGSPIVQEYEPTTTEISASFRDNLKLAVYAEENLEIKFTKQDLNWYIGKDEYAVEITDIQGNLYYKQIFNDDGDAKDSSKTGEDQPFLINLNNLPRNIYYVTFTKDNFNQAADSKIKNIKINSNKILIIGRFLPLEPFDFFVKSDYPWKIGFNYWHSGKDQEVTVIGTEKTTINLNKNLMNKKYEEELPRGNYIIDLPKGDLWVYTDFVSPNENSWFYPPQEIGRKLIDSDVIIIDKNILDIDGKKYSFRKEVNVSKDAKFKLQIIDETMAYFDKAELVI
ncbi:MAG: hypothetical protein WC548_01110 [Candidatus Pacearchaeota archaeon]